MANGLVIIMINFGYIISFLRKATARINAIIGYLPTEYFRVLEDWWDNSYLQRNTWKS